MTTAEIDSKGIALIEKFLDTIEDCENDFIDEYQLKFEGVVNKCDPKDDHGSKEYQQNKCEAEKSLKDRGEVKAGKTNDGNVDCLYKGQSKRIITILSNISIFVFQETLTILIFPLDPEH